MEEGVKPPQTAGWRRYMPLSRACPVPTEYFTLNEVSHDTISPLAPRTKVTENVVTFFFLINFFFVLYLYFSLFFISLSGTVDGMVHSTRMDTLASTHAVGIPLLQ